MTPDRFHAVINRYPQLRIAVAGDFCLDRYLEIDPAKTETSIETGLEVYNVVRVRSQPGGAGTILNNLVALGIGEIHPLGFAGRDGEGFELRRALTAKRGVKTNHFVMANQRQTFTYTKPLVLEPGKAPRELNRLDRKNWSPTPAALEKKLIAALHDLAAAVDAIILLDQVDVAETGVITKRFLETVRELATARPELLILADSRRGLGGYPPVCLKMNRAELATMTDHKTGADLDGIKAMAVALARQQDRPVFITLAGEGMIGASPSGEVHHVPAFPVKGEIDIVGAGDAVTANLAAALAAGATLHEALQLASAAASIVIHQLGTTGTATLSQIDELLLPAPGAKP